MWIFFDVEQYASGHKLQVWYIGVSDRIHCKLSVHLVVILVLCIKATIVLVHIAGDCVKICYICFIVVTRSDYSGYLSFSF